MDVYFNLFTCLGIYKMFLLFSFLCGKAVIGLQGKGIDYDVVGDTSDDETNLVSYQFN